MNLYLLTYQSFTIYIKYYIIYLPINYYAVYKLSDTILQVNLLILFTYLRILWLLAWLTAVILLTLLVKRKLDLLFSYPSNVEVWDEHVNVIDFPAITVCNRNPYR